MKRLLCILSGMNAGGAETFLMKLYRQIDRETVQMDFCINVKEKCFYEDEILSLGGKIYRIPAKSENVKEYRKRLFEVVKEGGYKNVLRITSNAAGFLDLKIAKKAGAEVCCARSSNSSDGGGLISFLAHRFGRMLYGRAVDVKIAPSDLAAIYTFGKKAYKSGEVTVLRNGLDTEKFSYSDAARKEVRREFGIAEDAFVAGHVGRFEAQKNHGFLLDAFAEMKKQNPASVLLLVGKGAREEEMKKKAEALLPPGSVVFAGERRDVPRLLSAMDAFVFPSLYEGMPNTVLEAQTNGLICTVSDAITKEANVTGKVRFLSLSSSPAAWASEVLSQRSACRENAGQIMRERGYDIAATARAFVQTVFPAENG